MGRKVKNFIFAVILLANCAVAQAPPQMMIHNGTAIGNANGVAVLLPGAGIRVCSAPASITNGVCSPQALIYSVAASGACSGSVIPSLQADTNGNYSFCTAPGNYIVEVSKTRFATIRTSITLSWGSTGSAAWGSITGSLSSQLDLKNSLDAKASAGDLPGTRVCSGTDKIAGYDASIHSFTCAADTGGTAGGTLYSGTTSPSAVSTSKKQVILVQSRTSGATPLVTTSPVTSGNLLLVSFTGGGSSGISTSASITDSLGTTFTRVNGGSYTGRDSSALYYGVAAGTGIDTITFGSPITNDGHWGLQVSEFANVSSTLDSQVMQLGSESVLGVGHDVSIQVPTGGDLVYAVAEGINDTGAVFNGWSGMTNAFNFDEGAHFPPTQKTSLGAYAQVTDISTFSTHLSVGGGTTSARIVATFVAVDDPTGGGVGGLGKTGDFFLNTVTGAMYGPKTALGWPSTPMVSGSQLHYGSGSPVAPPTTQPQVIHRSQAALTTSALPTCCTTGSMAVTSGNVLIVSIIGGGGDAILSDSLGTIFTLLKSPSSSYTQYLYYGVPTQTGTDVFTVTWNNPVGYPPAQMDMFDVSNLVPQTDVITAMNNFGVSATASTTQIYDFVMHIAARSGSSPCTTSGGIFSMSGYNWIATGPGGDFGQCIQYGNALTAGSITATFGGSAYSSYLVAFKARPGPGVGNNTDWYIDTVTGALYGPKAGGIWPSVPTPSSLPTQTGQSGKFLTTNGTGPSWSNPLPVLSGQSGKFLTNNGSAASWGTPAGYTQVQNSGSAMAARSVLNLTGAGVTCADNTGTSVTDCTIAGGGGGGGVGPDAPPTTPNALDDEFNGTTLDPKWIVAANGATGGQFTQAVGGGVLQLRISSPPTHTEILQSISGISGAWEFTARMSVVPDTFSGPANFYSGLVLMETSSGKQTDLFLTYHPYVTVGDYTLGFSFSGWNGSVIIPNQFEAFRGMYLRVGYDGTTNLYYQFSFDGYTYFDVIRSSKTRFFTTFPDRVGFDVTGASITGLNVNWFRRTK
jgi:hypothetical protein